MAGLEQELAIFVTPRDPVKVALLRLTNTSAKVRRLSVFGYVEWCLGPPRAGERRFVVTDIDAAAGGYKFLNLHAFRRLNPGGLLLTFSCSQHISIDLFQKIVFGAAVDAGRKVSSIKRLGPPVDHPVSLHHPEGEYLKGLALIALD